MAVLQQLCQFCTYSGRHPPAVLSRFEHITAHWRLSPVAEKDASYKCAHQATSALCRTSARFASTFPTHLRFQAIVPEAVLWRQSSLSIPPKLCAWTGQTATACRLGGPYSLLVLVGAYFIRAPLGDGRHLHVRHLGQPTFPHPCASSVRVTDARAPEARRSSSSACRSYPLSSSVPRILHFIINSCRHRPYVPMLCSVLSCSMSYVPPGAILDEVR